MFLPLLAAGTLLILGTFTDGASPHAAFGNLKYRADIASNSDVDYFKATLMAGEKIRAKVERARGSSLVPTLDLENATGQSVGIVLQESRGRAAGKAASFPWKRVTSSGTYAVLVKGKNGTSGAYSADFDIGRAVVKSSSGKGLLDGSSPRLIHSFEGAEGAELTFQIKWGRSDVPLRLVDITDPDGQPVANVDRRTNVGGRKIRIKQLPLGGRLGTYTLTVEQVGATPAAAPGKVANGNSTKYNFNANVRSPSHPKQRKPVQLDTNEPQLDPITQPIPVVSGQTVVLTGDNFSSDEGVTVLIGDEEATLCCATESTLEVTVPDGATGSTEDVTVVNSDSQTISETSYVTLQDTSAPQPPPPTTTPTPPPPAPSPNLPTNPSAFNWTDISPSTDSRTIYVSSSTGNDSNDGLSPQTAMKTPQLGYIKLRDGFPDRLLLKCGDTWDGGTTTYAFIGGSKSGRSASEPLVIGSYGQGARPKLLNGRFTNKMGLETNYVAVVGLHIERTVYQALSSFAIYCLGYGDGLLVEDCYIAGYPTNLIIQPTGGRQKNFKLRGSVVVDSFAGGGHSQGLLITDADGVLVEGCVFDHNSWDTARNVDPTVFSHNMYITQKCSGVTVRNTITARASATGVMQRPGGLCEDNLSLANPVGFSFGHNETAWNAATAPTGTVRWNVCLDSRDIADAARGMGIWMTRVSGMQVYENIIAHLDNGSMPDGIRADQAWKDLTIRDNVVYDWANPSAQFGNWALTLQQAGEGTSVVKDNTFVQPYGLTVYQEPSNSGSLVAYSNNAYWSGLSSAWFRLQSSMVSSSNWSSQSGETGATMTQPSFPDPSRDIASYHASLGGGASLQAFLTEARKQSRANWRPQYTAAEVNKYIRAGFGMTIGN